MAFGYSDAAARGIIHDGIVATFPAGSIVDFFNGSRPASANTAPSGTKLGTGAIPATPFGAGAGRGVPKQGVWQVTGLAAAGAGTDITWGRLKLAADNGATDATQARIDFDVVEAPTAGDCQLDNSNIATNQVVTINSFTTSVP